MLMEIFMKVLLTMETIKQEQGRKLLAMYQMVFIDSKGYGRMEQGMGRSPAQMEQILKELLIILDQIKEQVNGYTMVIYMLVTLTMVLQAPGKLLIPLAMCMKDHGLIIITYAKDLVQ